MRRSLVVLATAALALAACSGTGGASGGDSTASGEVSTVSQSTAESGSGTVSVDGAFGSVPTLAFQGDPGTELVVNNPGGGDGEEVAPGDYIVANYVGQVWGSDTAFNNSWDMGGPIGFSLNSVIQGWSEGIPGAKVGDRLTLVIPSDLGYPQGQPSAGINPGDTLVFVIDVLGAYSPDDLTLPWDSTVVTTDVQLPVTVDGVTGEPQVTLNAGAIAPSQMVATTTMQGSGPVIEDGGTVVFAYKAIGYDGTQMPGDNSWALGEPMAMTVRPGGILEALIGTTVGSRVVVESPATGSAPAAVLVIDVIDYIPPQG